MVASFAHPERLPCVTSRMSSFFEITLKPAGLTSRPQYLLGSVAAGFVEMLVQPRADEVKPVRPTCIGPTLNEARGPASEPPPRRGYPSLPRRSRWRGSP